MTCFYNFRYVPFMFDFTLMTCRLTDFLLASMNSDFDSQV
jgi:hypothetical protein